MAIGTAPVPVPRRPLGDLRLPAWAAALLAVALVLLAGGVGAAIMAQVAGRAIQVQVPGQSAAGVPNTVTVQGVGRVAAPPDTLLVDVGVDVVRPSVADALTAAAAGAGKLTDALTGAGVAGADMQTTGLNVYPRFDYAGAVSGYDASTTMHVRIRDLGKANATLSAAAVAVGNDVRFGGMSYDRADIAAQTTQARQAALAAASSQATEAARAAGQQLGKISAINQQYVGYSGQVKSAGGIGGLGGGGGGVTVPQIQAGQGEVLVAVTVTYELR